MDWNTIVQNEGPMVFRTAWRILNHVNDAEDAVQQAFLDAWEEHCRAPVRNWGGFLRHLVTRRAIDMVRQRRRTVTLASDLVASRSDQPVPEAIMRELASRLRGAVARLPDREATVFSLRYFGELTNAEIAVLLGITSDAVGVALHKARVALRKNLNLVDARLEQSASARTGEDGSQP